MSLKALEEQRELINDNKKIKEVATLSAKDDEIGGLIAEVMEKIGKEGVVTVEDSNTIGNSYEMVEGMQFDRGYVSQYMVTNQEKMEASLDEPYVLVTDKKISSIQEILPLAREDRGERQKRTFDRRGRSRRRSACDACREQAARHFQCACGESAGFRRPQERDAAGYRDRDRRDVIAEDLGKKLENAELDDLGHAHRVVSDKDKTTIVGGKGEKKDIESRVAQLKAQIKKTDSDFDKEKLQERLGKLAGGVAVIKVGAPTEAAQKELKQRVEDAVNATRAAMEEGIVPGGGIALFNVEHEDWRTKNPEVAQGFLRARSKRRPRNRREQRRIGGSRGGRTPQAEE